MFKQSMTKEDKSINGEKTVFNKWWWEKWTALCKKKKKNLD